MKKQYFGTDGIRGRVGQWPITPDFMLKLGWAAGKVFGNTGRNHILIGKDTRISGYMFESALESGLSAAGVNISLLGPMPTPAVAYLTRTFLAQAGIVISASHNPYHDNGIKFFGADGGKLDDQIELAIEAQLEKPLEIVANNQLGKVTRINDASGRYIEFCKSTVPISTNLSGLHVVIDCAHGATYHVAPNVFRELGATVTSINTEPNGLNINDKCGSTSPKSLQVAVVELQADLGVAFDGDGDRVIMVDHQGEIVDGDEIVYIIARHRHESGRLQGGVVGTLMSNLGLELSLRELDIPFIRTKVGDRHILAELAKKHWFLGGEASGHVVCRDATTTGDGIIAAIQVVADMAQRNQSLHELKAHMIKLPQKIVNVQINQPIDLEKPAIKSAISNAEKVLCGHGRVLLRPSGTEPVVRIMVEGEQAALVNQLADDLAALIKETTTQVSSTH